MKQESVRPRWPYDMRPSARVVHVCHCNSLGGATWRTITERTDRQTDRQTDRVRRNMRPPPREEGRIKSAQRDANTARALAVVRFGHRPRARPPTRCKHTNPQTGPITIHCTAAS